MTGTVTENLHGDGLLRFGSQVIGVADEFEVTVSLDNGPEQAEGVRFSFGGSPAHEAAFPEPVGALLNRSIGAFQPAKPAGRAPVPVERP